MSSTESLLTADGSDKSFETRLALLKGNKSPKPLDPSTLMKLDGSIKKNTSFVKKFKSFSADQLPALIKEMEVLKLEKYLEEIAICIVSEAKLKTQADILAAAEICSLLYQRFASVPFVQTLVDQLVQHLGTKDSLDRDKGDPSKLSRLRSSLRLLSELYLVGLLNVIMPVKKADALVVDALANLTASFKGGEGDPFPYLAVIVTFAKSYVDQFSASISIKISLLSSSVAQEWLKLIQEYVQRLQPYLVEEDRRLKRVERQNTEAAINRGTINAEREEKLEKMTARFEKWLGHCVTLSNLVGLEMPVFASLESSQPASIVMDASSAREEKDFSSSPWENEDSREFYRGLVDLKNFVPGLILGTSLKSTEDATPPQAPSLTDAEIEALTKTDTLIDVDVTETDSDALVGNVDAQNDEEDTAVTANIPSNTIASLEALFLRLPNCLSKDLVDKWAVEFAFINSKPARKRLLKALTGVSRHQADLIPYYCRLLATTNPYMPDVTATVIRHVSTYFKGDLRRKKQDVLDDRVKNVRYLGELVKFDLLPSHITYFVIKALLEDFNSLNVDILCAFLESCGRFLYRTSQHSERFQGYLEIMMKKKASVKLNDVRQAAMIEHAYYLCNPPEAPPIQVKVRTPLEMYLRQWFYARLNPEKAQDFLVILCRLDWADPSVVSLLEKMFWRPWKVRFSNLQTMAYLVAGLCRYYPQFSIGVVDNVFEEIRLGMERNLFKHNQRRIATVKFLGELYLYQLMTSTHIFECLYFILRFGHDQGIPRPGVECTIDIRHDFFRVRLVCALLETVGNRLTKGRIRQKLDTFLLFLQAYLFTKAKPPVDVEFLVGETFDAIAPKLKMFTGYEEVVNELNRVHASPNPEGGEEDEAAAGPEEENVSSEIEETSNEDDDSDEQEAHVIYHEEIVEDDADDLDFEQEYRKMMLESLEGRKGEPRPTPTGSRIDGILPSQGAQFLGTVKASMLETSESGQVKFSLLTRKGNKSMLREMELPSDSTIAISTRANIERQQMQNQDIKKRVLKYEEEHANEARSMASSNLFPLLADNAPPPTINMIPGLESVPGSRRVRRVLYSKPNAPSIRRG